MGVLCHCLVCVAVLMLATLVCVNASPTYHTITGSSRAKLAVVIRSILDTLGVKEETKPLSVIYPREGASECNDSSQCFPPTITNVPSNLITCDGGQCLCKDCFERGSDGKCVDSEEVCEDYYYSSEYRKCVDERKSQLSAFLLSIFCSPLGAANFYIGQNGLGAAQLIILLLMFGSCYSLCCLPFCMAACLTKDNVKSGVIFIVFGMATIVVILLCAIAIWAWWLIDLIIFATNERDAGNGCSLIRDF